MAASSLSQNIITISSLATDGATRFIWVPDDNTRASIAETLGLIELRKLRAELRLEPSGDQDWLMQADWGATVVQPCVVTLEPVVTRLDEGGSVTFTKNMPEVSEAEAEMPEDETLEPLGSEIDVAATIGEMLALALPRYPRADGAELGEAIYGPPGTAPMSDDDAKPFAGLAALRHKMMEGKE